MQSAALTRVMVPARHVIVATSIQIEGLADRPTGAELERVREMYLARFADGRERADLPTIAYWRVRPTWIRFRDFNKEPATIIEWDSIGLAQNLPEFRR